MAAAVTESLPNSKTSNAAKRGDAMEASKHAASSAVGRQKPCVVMKRTDLIYPVQLRSAMEVQGVGQTPLDVKFSRLNYAMQNEYSVGGSS